MTVIICRPRSFGLAEAKDIRCLHCRRETRHWLWCTNDAWYDPTFTWRCGECDRGRRPVKNGDLKPEPLHWRLAVEDAVAQVRAETAPEGSAPDA